ncbi:MULTISPECIES: preprotein translocase subunit SecY [Exiguobacterium]|uniref:preprotein translocase subunit SecY n=1 Tax=Exiguobacterium TaxID=33986 RepID=UPI001BAC0BFE|nr:MULTISPECIES: preprotein translocase subunit SecY [Exiguobacterium]MCT4784068.1 preprotein translocase subunit SecY [Exiguobacterium himgiriensis]QUE86792.1 preprotein translocase subunit SecY [Exiguobacterium alkaliphilum]
MFQTISNMWRVKDIRQRILFTLAIIIIFRIGAHIPVPMVNTDVLRFDSGGLLDFLNLFGGNALQNFSLFAMGIMPYITASIVVQLLQMDVVPKFAEWAKQGEAGRKKLATVTRYGTIILGFIQATSLSFGFNRLYPGLVNETWGTATYFVIAIVLTAGTAFLMFLGEMTTERGVGNGISIIIFAGIVAGFPRIFTQIYETKLQNAGDALFINIVYLVVLALVILAVTVGIIYVQQAARKIPIQYAKRTANRTPVGGQSTHLPIKLNAAGVIPVIFAISFMVTPPTVASFIASPETTQKLQTYFDTTAPIGMSIYVALIIAFAYFYTFVQVNPEQMAENLQKQGGYIPGIRPGAQTEQYITKLLYRLTFFGAIFLSVVAIMPTIFIKLAGLPTSVQIGGTSLLIVIGVALETMKQIESQLVKRHYKGFIR